MGLALSLPGARGILCQLIVYPPVQARLGLLRSFQLSCFLFPIAYVAMPFISFLSADSIYMRAAILCILGTQETRVRLRCQVTSFCLPTASRGRVLGTVNGIASSIASAARAIGPVLGAMCFAAGLDGGGVGIGGVSRGMAVVATGGAVGGG